MKEINKDMFKDMKTIAIYGNCGSGKTALAYSLINMLKGSDKKVYFLKHPKPELIEELGYFNLESLEMIEKLQDCIIYFSFFTFLFFFTLSLSFFFFNPRFLKLVALI